MAATNMLKIACLTALVASACGAYLTIETPITNPFNTALQTGAVDLPLTDQRVAMTVTGLTPEQVHLTYINATTVLVSWVTGAARVGNNVTQYDPTTVGSVVRYGMGSALSQNATGDQFVYTQTYNSSYALGLGLNYTSGIIHHTTLTGLTPFADYSYSVGDPKSGVFSKVYNFTTLPATGSSFQYPLRIGVLADPGQTYNTSVTFDHFLANDPQIAFLVGDFTYADNFNTNGDLPTAAQKNATLGYGTYQGKWDTFGRLIEPIVSTIPLLHTNGNHEIERTALNQTQLSYTSRYPTPFAQSGSTSPLYYSANVGPVHTIWLSSYIAFDQSSAQYAWFANDLSMVNRTRTPWVIVNWHAPWYNTYISHYKENNCMQQIYEPLFFQYGVDISFLGHVHAYERTNPVFNYTVNQCGTVHITIGDGGNNEKLYTTFVDTPGQCPQNSTPTAKGQPTYQPQFCPAGLLQDGLFCPRSQPAWSAYREPSFGHGTLDVLNSTHALWQWHRNQDAAAVVTDAAYIVRGASTPAANCATVRGPGASNPAATAG